jgi:hypothetical protein
VIKTLGCAGGAAVAVAACAESLEKYLFATGTFWIIAAVFVGACWGYETFCVETNDDETK